MNCTNEIFHRIALKQRGYIRILGYHSEGYLYHERLHGQCEISIQIALIKDNLYLGILRPNACST